MADEQTSKFDDFVLVARKKRKADKLENQEPDNERRLDEQTDKGKMNEDETVNAGGDGKKREKVDLKYKREWTVLLQTENIPGLNAYELIKIIERVVGTGELLALRPKQNRQFEATMNSEVACEKMEDGMRFGENTIEVKRLHRAEVMVSFLHLPPGIPDRQILDRLVKWGVQPTLPVRRRYYPGTTVTDGTRFLKVKFPKEVVSLPYSARFETEDGPQYCRVIHDKQVKICRLCMSPGHVLRDCPTFVCRECLEQGHYARECTAARCEDCRLTLMKCTCLSDTESEPSVVREETVASAPGLATESASVEERSEGAVAEEDEVELGAALPCGRQMSEAALSPMSTDCKITESTELVEGAVSAELLSEAEPGGEKEQNLVDSDIKTDTGVHHQNTQMLSGLTAKNEFEIVERLRKQSKRKKKTGIINLPLVLKNQESRRSHRKELV